MAIKKLKDMKPGESGLIVALHGSGNVKHRLIDMGLVNGTKIHVMKFAFGGSGGNQSKKL